MRLIMLIIFIFMICGCSGASFYKYKYWLVNKEYARCMNRCLSYHGNDYDHCRMICEIDKNQY